MGKKGNQMGCRKQISKKKKRGDILLPTRNKNRYGDKINKIVVARSSERMAEERIVKTIVGEIRIGEEVVGCCRDVLESTAYQELENKAKNRTTKNGSALQSSVYYTPYKSYIIHRP